MPNAVLHVILTIILIDIFRDYVLPKHHHHRFPRWMVLVGGIAGLAPDIDVPISWVVSWISNTTVSFHGGITHTLIFPIVIALVGFVLHFMNKKKASIVMWIVAFGWFFHLTLDCTFLGAYNPLWPINGVQFCPHTFSNNIMPGLDAVLLIAWLIHEEVKHKIKDYI